jgi:hypothetical protein
MMPKGKCGFIENRDSGSHFSNVLTHLLFAFSVTTELPALETLPQLPTERVDACENRGYPEQFHTNEHLQTKNKKQKP